MLFCNRGPRYKVELDDGTITTVVDLLEQIYHEAGTLKIWWLIRYTAGMLGKRAQSLATVSSNSTAIIIALVVKAAPVCNV